jgi:hypothetical protein
VLFQPFQRMRSSIRLCFVVEHNHQCLFHAWPSFCDLV